MPDPYAPLRTIPFPVIGQALGVDLSRFKTRRDGEHYGPCPVHPAKSNTTSFSYHQDGRYFCFSCNTKGRGSIDLIKAIKKINFTAAIEFLTPLVSQAIPTQKHPPEVKSDATAGEIKPLEKDSWRKFAVPCPWLEQRVPDAGIRERYGLFAYDNPSRPKSSYRGRVMIPIKNLEGHLYGYLGRHVPTDDSKEQPKYLWPSQLPKHFLFGAHELKDQAPVKVLFVVESPLTVLHFASLKLPVVAAYGWSVSEEQVSILASLTRAVVYLPDRNKYDNAHDVIARISSRLYVKAPPLPVGVDDPESLLHEQALALL